MKEKITAFIRAQKKEQLLAGLLLIALALVIFWPTGQRKRTVPGEDAKEAEQKYEEADNTGTPAAQMERELAAALAQVEGVGAVQVAITLESTGRKVVEKDVPEAKSRQLPGTDSGSGESSTETSEEATVYERDGDGAEVPYVVSEEYPAVRGVLVIAEGGGNPILVREIQEAVMALFQVDAHKIKVMKMK